jgi:hypothetical protein
LDIEIEEVVELPATSDAFDSLIAHINLANH